MPIMKLIYINAKNIKKFPDKRRAQRAKLFLDTVYPTSTDKIIDPGGGDRKHINGILGNNSFEDVLIADILIDNLAYSKEKVGYKTHQLKEADSLPFEDKEFDTIFGNSVLENVTILKNEIWSFKDTKGFKSEI